ncbi:hypothetical protein AYO21_10622 [Fonsecaea monophora]|uniref:VOC domain-containing protein n=1 Tax=Fonsecaea monophora TaxID=254056 RepID=A0A177ET89_9EURO|nr:hypothetical protein AYO21_10622 [Fonsecaea monophora]OAG35224.1 hypothetical protein AYO21_10622 [Fonsecaea monophora]
MGSASEQPNLVALFGVQQNTPRLEEQIKLYNKIGYVIDDGFQLADGEQLPDAWFSARGVKRGDLDKFVAMKLPGDAYMHVFFYSWKNLITKNQWPAPFNLIGSRGMTFLFDDVEKELARIKKDFPETKVLQEPYKVRRKWGVTTQALIIDPEDLWVELISIDQNPFEKLARPPNGNEISLLHFQVNCRNFEKSNNFYKAFGMTHDTGVNERHVESAFPDGFDVFKKQMKDAFNFIIEDKILDVGFLRNPRDPSLMHLELLETIDNGRLLKDPGLDPTWSQKGICRYCHKTPDYFKSLDDMKKLGCPIYVECQKMGLNWGDTVWFYFGDRDGNLICLEEWKHCRFFGGRY